MRLGMVIWPFEVIFAVSITVMVIAPFLLPYILTFNKSITEKGGLSRKLFKLPLYLGGIRITYFLRVLILCGLYPSYQFFLLPPAASYRHLQPSYISHPAPSSKYLYLL